MKKLVSRFRLNNLLLKVYEVTNAKGEKYFRGVQYEFKYIDYKFKLVLKSGMNFNDCNIVLSHFDMVGAKMVNSDSYIDLNHRVIWNNTEYDAWKESMLDDGFEEEELTYERYYEDCDMFLDDERANLNKKVDGYIVAFADLGLWNGRVNGAKVIGSNVKDILYSSCDYVDWYCDKYNVRCDGAHHDGTNHILYRVAKDRDDAERLTDLVAYHGMSEEEFRKATKSLRPYIARIYGF